MWRFASLILLLTLTGCGSSTWWNPPFTGGTNPHAPSGESETMRRAMGQNVEEPALNPQPGDVWPGPLPPTPTLQDLERQGNIQPMAPLPSMGSSQSRGRGTMPNGQPPSPPPTRARGSSTPPGSALPGVPPPITTPPPAAPPSAAAAPPAPNPAGQPVQTSRGTGVTTGGTSGYRSITMPDGTSGIVVPNGNGTSTVIRSDGTIETIPTPR